MADYVTDFPFSFNSYGQVSDTNDQRIIWRNRVRHVLFTRFGERVMRPSFGSGILDSLFETEELALEMVNRSVTIAFNTQLNSLKLIEMRPEYDSTTGTLDVSIRYALPNGELDTVTFNTALFNRYGDVIQETTHG